MSKFLTETTEVYRIDTEEEVKEFIEDMKDKAREEGFSLKSYSSTYKEKKMKGEVIDSCWQTKIVKNFSSLWD